MIEWIKRHWVVAAAGAGVVATWSACFIITFLRAHEGPDVESLARFGQFGDTFGSINALFTGLALVGLVHTVLQQQKQIQQQEADLQESRQAFAREKRELFLTARLNAAVALLHAHESRGRFSAEGDDYARLNAMRETAKLTHPVAILLSEANLGFEHGDWSPELEKLAIRDYLRAHFEELIYRSNLPATSPLRFQPRPGSREKHDLDTLCEQIRHRHPEVADLTQQFADYLMALKSPEEAVKHIRDFLDGTVGHL